MSDRELALLEREAQRSPGDVSVLVRLGLCYERTRRLRDAFVTYSRARRVAPDDPTVLEHWERLGGGQETRFCEQLLASGLGPTARSHAASLLGVCGDELGRDALRHALREDESFSVRQTAAAALGELRDREALGDLFAALEDASGWVRARATDALQRIVNGRGYPSVSTEAKALEPRVREWREWAREHGPR